MSPGRESQCLLPRSDGQGLQDFSLSLFALKVCWVQERLFPGSATARTSFPGDRRPVPPRRRALGLTSGLLLPFGALVFRATLQLLPPPPRLPSNFLTSPSPRAGTLQRRRAPFAPPPYRSGLGYSAVTTGSSPPHLSSPPPLQSWPLHSSSLCLPPPPLPPPAPPTAATSWFEEANGRAPPGVSYLHHVGEGERGGQVEPHPKTEKLSAIARASRGCSRAPRLFHRRTSNWVEKGQACCSLLPPPFLPWVWSARQVWAWVAGYRLLPWRPREGGWALSFSLGRGL